MNMCMCGRVCRMLPIKSLLHCSLNRFLVWLVCFLYHMLPVVQAGLLTCHLIYCHLLYCVPTSVGCQHTFIHLQTELHTYGRRQDPVMRLWQGLSIWTSLAWNENGRQKLLFRGPKVQAPVLAKGNQGLCANWPGQAVFLVEQLSLPSELAL